MPLTPSIPHLIRLPSIRTLASQPARIHRIPRASRSAPAPPVYVQTGLTAALIGRPNVGKSTLFNRLAAALRGRSADAPQNPSPIVFVKSVVDSAPGVTRDPRDAAAALLDLRFSVVDTPGLERRVSSDVSRRVVKNQDEVSGDFSLVTATAHCEDMFYRQMYKNMEAGAVQAVLDADLVFFMLDAAEGVTQVDSDIAKWLHSFLRRQAEDHVKKQVVLIANKCDVASAEASAPEMYSLGFGDPIVLSAEHNLGFGDFYTALADVHQKHKIELCKKRVVTNVPEIVTHQSKEEKELEEMRNSFEDELIVGISEKAIEQPLRQLIVSIVGRPNVGKSTLLNRLAGKEKSLVGPVAGVTRDAVLCEWNPPTTVKRKDSIPVWLVDTAGVRPQSKVDHQPLERLSVRSSFRALRHSHVVIVLLDSTDPLCHQDMKLLDLAVCEGRAVVLVVNKMDKVTISDIGKWRQELRYKVDSKVSDLKGVEIVEMSAKEWQNGPEQSSRLFAAVERARFRWEKRIPTSNLNRFVIGFNERMSVGGSVQSEKRNRIGVTKFITQKKIRPPMFRLDGSSAVSMNYLRSLTNALRSEFGFEGVPIRVKRPSRRRRK